MNYFTSWISAIFLLFGHLASAQFESTYIENFTKEDYKSANQNWGISVDANNFVYVANNEGLLVYDGMRWEKYQMSGNTILRSVNVLNDTIFVGSYEEFGYFLSDSSGFLNYTSLSDSIEPDLLKNLEFWQINKIGGRIIFKSFSRIFSWDGKKIVELSGITSTVITSFVQRSKYLVGTLDKGIFFLNPNENSFRPLKKSDFFLDESISALTNIGDKILVATSKNGCFIETATGFVEWNTEVNEYLQKYQINKISTLPDGRLVFGTILNGLYITDKNGNIQFHLSKLNGLQNNTILSQTLDKNGNLWLGLDNGIDMVGLNIPIKYYTDKTGVLGSVYALHAEKDMLILGSNKGVFTLVKDSLKLVPNSQGHVWEITKLDNQIFVSHNVGLFLMDRNRFDKVQGSLGGWYFNKIPESKQYFQGLYNGIGIFEPSKNPIKVKKLKGFADPVKFMAFENKKLLWVTHPYKGVQKLILSQRSDSVVDIREYTNKGIKTIYKAAVFEMGGRIIFPSHDGWQLYQPLSDSIVMYDELNQKLGEFKSSKMLYQDDNGVWFDSHNQLVYFDKKTQKIWKLPMRYYRQRLVRDNVEIIKFANDKWLLALDDGYAKIDEQLLNANEKNPEQNIITIRHIKSNGKYTGLKGNITKVESGKNSVEIYLATNQRNQLSGIKYRLDEYEKDWNVTLNGNIKYSNIPSGEYNLEMIALDNQGNEVGPVLKNKIDVLPPWYLSNWAKSGYVISFLLLLFGLYAINRLLIKKNQKRLRLKHLQEQRNIMHEKKIELEKKLIQIKSQQYQQELINKEKELANTAITMLRNKENLKQIKKEFEAKKDVFTDPFSYKRLIKKLDRSIENDEAKSIFETNFDAVHEEFLKKILQNHPELTPKDLKLCAMLRMNLSNKEIAPLLNITYRSVELQRYRLRKKLNLTTGEDLIKYLLQF